MTDSSLGCEPMLFFTAGPRALGLKQCHLSLMYTNMKCKRGNDKSCFKRRLVPFAILILLAYPF